MVNRAVVSLVCVALILIPFEGLLFAACERTGHSESGKVCGCGCQSNEHQANNHGNCPCVTPCALERVSLRSDMLLVPAPDSAHRLVPTTDSTEADVSHRQRPDGAFVPVPANRITVLLKTCVFRS